MVTPDATVKKYLTVQSEGNRQVSRDLDHYNLQMIVAVGFKVNNQRAVQFRKWAGQIVKDHTIQGWTMGKERLKKGHMFTDEYFERQLQYIREMWKELMQKKKCYISNVSGHFILIIKNKNKPEEWRFEIGKMARVLIMTLEGKEENLLFLDFRSFLERIFAEEFFKNQFEKSLDEIADLRNKCAHPNIVDENKKNNVKSAIREKLDNILKYYK